MGDSIQSALIIMDKTIFKKKVEVQKARTLQLIKKISIMLSLKCEVENESGGTIITTLSCPELPNGKGQMIKHRTRINVALNIIEIIQKLNFKF